MLKRFIKNDKKIDQFFEYMFIDSREVFGYLGKEQIVMQTTNCNANNKLQWKQQIQLIWSKPEQFMKDYFPRDGEELISSIE